MTGIAKVIIRGCITGFFAWAVYRALDAYVEDQFWLSAVTVFVTLTALFIYSEARQ